MAEIRWTHQAADDLESITEFISQDSSHYARFFALEIIEAIERLGDFPELGRVVPEKDDPIIREIIMGNYRIVYRLKDNLIELLTIHHGAAISWNFYEVHGLKFRGKGGQVYTYSTREDVVREEYDFLAVFPREEGDTDYWEVEFPVE